MPNTGGPPARNGNGVKIPVWAISVLVVLVLQLISFIVVFSEVRTNQQHLQNDVAEIKFTVGNIQEGMQDVRDDQAHMDEKCQTFERRITRLEDAQ